MADIFVSYASEDRDRIEPLVEALIDEGWTVWWDRELVAGPSFEERIEQAIAEARCVIVSWSKHSIASRWCRAEANEGLERGILVPILIDSVRPPLSFRGSQTASLTEWPNNRGELASVIAGVRECLGAKSELEPLDPTSTHKHRSFPLRSTLTVVAIAVVLVALWVGREVLTDQGSEVASLEPGNIQIERVAVLPFRNLSAQANNDYIANGLTEELRLQIAAWNRFEVLPSALVRGLETNALRDHADILLDGYLREEDGKVSVSVEVVRLGDNSVQWSGQFSGQLDSPFQLQRQIAANVARVFNQSVPDSSGPANPNAYQAYLRFLSASDSYGKIEESHYWMDRVLELEPTWTQGWRQTVMLRIQIFFMLNDETFLESAHESLQQLRQLNDPTLSTATAEINAFGYAKFANAEPVFRDIAFRYGSLMLSAGLYDEAEALFGRLVELAPYSSYNWEHLAMARANNGDFTGALHAMNQIIPLNPPNSPGPLLQQAIMQMLIGDTVTPAAALDALRSQIDQAKPGSLSFRLNSYMYHFFLFRMSFASGNLEEAASAAQWFADNGQHTRAALYFFLLNDPKATTELMLSKEEQPYVVLGWFYETYLLTEEQRGHPFIRELEGSLGLTPEWRLDLCERAARFPHDSDISCDPAKYQDTQGLN